jgi:hypothetical protein
MGNIRHLNLQFAALHDEIGEAADTPCPAPPFSSFCPSADSLDWPASKCNHKQKTCFLARIELVRLLRAWLILSAVLLPALPGCRSEDGIHQETVTHPDRQSLRLRVAILERGDTVWFIRLDGPEEQVAQHQAAFDGFVRSTEFTDKKDDPEPLKWRVPDGWKKAPPGPPGMGRYAAFRIDAKPKELEVKISKLSKEEFRLMENMHRWQKQMDVKLSDVAADNEQYLKDETIGDQKITWVDMNGLGVHNVSKPSDANAGLQKDFLGGLIDEKGKQPFKYTAPAGWKEVAPVKFAANTYEIGAGGATAKVSVSSLSGPMAGDLAENVKRWRGQVGLEPLPRAEVAQAGKRIQVGGFQSHYFDIENPKGPPAKNRILAVMVPVTRTNPWFVVMSGPSDLVGQNKNAFETFVESFKK